MHPCLLLGLTRGLTRTLEPGGSTPTSRPSGLAMHPFLLLLHLLSGADHFVHQQQLRGDDGSRIEHLNGAEWRELVVGSVGNSRIPVAQPHEYE